MSLYSEIVLADLPNAYWRMSDLNDLAGNNNDLTNPGGTSNPAAGASLLFDDADASKDFDGTDDYQFADDHSTLDLGDTLTLEAWVRVDAAPSTTGYLISKGNNAYALRVDATRVVEFVKQNVGIIVTSTVALTVGTTYHIVATKDGATVKLYINGVDRTGTVTNQTLTNTTAVLTLGQAS